MSNKKDHKDTFVEAVSKIMGSIVARSENLKEVEIEWERPAITDVSVGELVQTSKYGPYETITINLTWE